MPSKSTKTYDNFNFLWDGPIMSQVFKLNSELILRNSFIGRFAQTKRQNLQKYSVIFMGRLSDAKRSQSK
jgi:hypothetical protein